MRRAFSFSIWTALCLLLLCSACGRKGDPSPRKTPQGVHGATAAPATAGQRP